MAIKLYEFRNYCDDIFTKSLSICSTQYFIGREIDYTLADSVNQTEKASYYRSKKTKLTCTKGYEVLIDLDLRKLCHQYYSYHYLEGPWIEHYHYTFRQELKMRRIPIDWETTKKKVAFRIRYRFWESPKRRLILGIMKIMPLLLSRFSVKVDNRDWYEATEWGRKLIAEMEGGNK